MTEMMTVGRRPVLVLPTYNERDNVRPIVESIRRELPHAAIWIVDDNSPDGTGEIADQLAAEYSQITVFHRASKLGLGTAYVEAFQRALEEDFDCILEMDADFSHDPTYLPQLVEALGDADLVIGSRYIAGGGTENWSPIRQAISRGGNLVARVGLGIKTRDATGGFRAFRRSTLEQIHFGDSKLSGYAFQIEIVYQVQQRELRIQEIPIVFVERVAGASKMSKAIVLEAMLHILRRRLATLRRRPQTKTDPEHRATSR